MANDSISDADKALFRAQMREVKPLKKSARKEPVTQPKAYKTEPLPKIRPAAPLSQERCFESDYALSDYIRESIGSESCLSYALPGLPKKRLAALKRGAIPIEARLDLHGYTAEEARKALCSFMHTQTTGHKQSLLIIHGKGGHQGGHLLVSLPCHE